MKRYQNALFVFHRDLRLTDNRALSAALAQSARLSCAFVLDPVFNRQPSSRLFARQFLLQALQRLDESLQNNDAGLFLLSGNYVENIKLFVIENAIDAVFVNAEYAKYGRARQAALKAMLAELGIDLQVYDDALLFPPGFVLKNDGKPYTVFTPFYRRACQFPVEKPRPLIGQAETILCSPPLNYEFSVARIEQYWQIKHDQDICNQRMEVMERLGQCEHYAEQRDFPALQATSGLSVHLKFGTVSVREAYWSIVSLLGADSPLLRQLYWRDFFSNIGFHFPHVFDCSFHAQFTNIIFENDREKFARWCEGKTGFPIVDAGMRELNQTGFMHNRVRMIVASFLVKDLHVDWRWGERYFAEKLVDYDIAVNNGNWQWAASTGCDAQPYFRIFNPWLQQQKFDPDCGYIYQWLPELRLFPPRVIHRWYEQNTVCEYPLPVIDHAVRAQQARLMFQQASAQYRDGINADT